MIYLYSVMYNEERLLPFFIEHYKPIVDKIIIYDNESTDNSVQIAKQSDCEVRTLISEGFYRDDLITGIKDKSWHEVKLNPNVNWIIIVDIDEFIYHPNLRQKLEQLRHIQKHFIIPSGFQIVTTEFPDTYHKLIENCQNGVLDFDYSKPCIFNPHIIKELNLTSGSHQCHPKTQRRRINIYPGSDIYLFHLANLSFEYRFDKYHRHFIRYHQINRDNKWGWQYLETREEMQKRFDDLLLKVKPIKTNDLSSRNWTDKLRSKLLHQTTSKKKKTRKLKQSIKRPIRENRKK